MSRRRGPCVGVDWGLLACGDIRSLPLRHRPATTRGATPASGLDFHSRFPWKATDGYRGRLTLLWLLWPHARGDRRVSLPDVLPGIWICFKTQARARAGHERALTRARTVLAPTSLSLVLGMVLGGPGPKTMSVPVQGAASVKTIQMIEHITPVNVPGPYRGS